MQLATRIKSVVQRTLKSMPQVAPTFSSTKELEKTRIHAPILDTPQNKHAPDSYSIQLNAIKAQKIDPATEKPKKMRETLNWPNNRISRSAARPKDFERRVPNPITVLARIENNEIAALIDTGSGGDFISTTVVDQLGLKLEPLAKPLQCQLAATGSGTMIQYSTTVKFELMGISEQRQFDVINIDIHDCILGTPFIWQHSVLIGMNPSQFKIGHTESIKLAGEGCTIVHAAAVYILNQGIDEIKKILLNEVSELCKSAGETPLPPLRVINHEIPVIDPKKVYRWRPSRVPEAFRKQRNSKREEYLRLGRWRFANTSNAIPMMFIARHSKDPDGQPRLRTVLDKC
jgi:Aspartyl protease